MSIPDLDATSPGEATREFYRQQGRKQEQERIIAALDEVIYSWDEKLRISSDFDTFQDLIALIKGEK